MEMPYMTLFRFIFSLQKKLKKTAVTAHAR